jgi:ankyrin repeat protein
MSVAARHQLWAACELLVEKHLGTAPKDELEQVLISSAAGGQERLFKIVLDRLTSVIHSQYQDRGTRSTQAMMPRAAALMAAAACNQVALCSLILKTEMDWMYVYLALNAAAAHGAVAAVKLLLPWWPRPASSRWQQYANNSCLLPMIMRHFQSMHTTLRQLYIHAAPLTVAAQNGQIEVMRLLLGRGAHIDNWRGTPYAGARTTNSGPLIAAVAAGQLEAVRFLLQHGADVHPKAEEAAARKGHEALHMYKSIVAEEQSRARTNTVE